MKSPNDPGFLQDSASLHNSISQNMPNKYGIPLLIFFYNKLILIFHKKSPQNVIYIRRKKFISVERLIWMRTDFSNKEYFEI